MLKKNLEVIGNDNEGYFVPQKGDYKEYFHLGRHTYKAFSSDQETGLASFAHNQARKLKINHLYFTKKAMRYSEKGIEMGDAILCALENKLDLKIGELVSQATKGNHIARFLNYFPQDKLTAKEQEGLIRAKAHTDICALTFLPPSKTKGLQVLKKQNLATAFSPKDELRSDSREWIDVPYMDDTIICNIGQSLSIKLNGILPPTAHRVRNPSAEDAVNPRIAMPFFYHFDEDMSLAPLSKAVEMNSYVNLFENAKNITLKQYVEAESEFHPNRSLCRPNEHTSVYLKEKFAVA